MLLGFFFPPSFFPTCVSAVFVAEAEETKKGEDPKICIKETETRDVVICFATLSIPDHSIF